MKLVLQWWMAKTEKSIKYCARKCHNGGPLTKMMAAEAAETHTKKFCRTIGAAIRRYIRSGGGVVTSQLLMIKPHIKSGAQMSPHLTYRLLLTALTLVSSVQASSSYKDDEGRTQPLMRLFLEFLCEIPKFKIVSYFEIG